MRKFFRFFVVFCLLVFLVAAGAVVYAVRNSSDILITQIERHLGVKASAAGVRYVFPSTLVISDLRVGDQIKVEGLLIAPSLIGFFQKRAVVFNEILVTGPEVRVVRRSDETIDIGLPLPSEPAAPPSQQAPQEMPPKEAAPLSAPDEQKTQPVYVEHLRVLNGRVTFIDESGGAPPFRADLVDIRAEARRASLLEPLRMKAEVSARLEGEGEGVEPGELRGTGEYDIGTRKGTACLDLTRVPLVFFQRYYDEYVSKRIASGTLTAGGDFRVDGNDLFGDCRLSLENMAFQKEGEEDAQKGKTWKDIGTLVASSMFLAAGETTFDVSFRTRLDRPRFENVKMKGVFAKPESLAPFAVEGALEGKVEDFKKIGEEFEAVGREFKKMFDF